MFGENLASARLLSGHLPSALEYTPSVFHSQQPTLRRKARELRLQNEPAPGPARSSRSKSSVGGKSPITSLPGLPPTPPCTQRPFHVLQICPHVSPPPFATWDPLLKICHHHHHLLKSYPALRTLPPFILSDFNPRQEYTCRHHLVYTPTCAHAHSHGREGWKFPKLNFSLWCVLKSC